MEFKILTGSPNEVETKLNEIEGKVEIKSVKFEFDKYGCNRMAIVVSVTGVATFPSLKGDKNG